MNKKNLLSSAVATALLAGVISQSAFAATDTGQARAQIITPITITTTTTLYFGSIQAAVGGDTIALDTSNNAVPAGTSVVTGTPTSGSFDVSGTPNALYTITLPASTLLNFGAFNMTVNNFSHNAGATPTIDVSGTSALNIGADLIIAAGQAEGVYTGSYDVIVDYQ